MGIICVKIVAPVTVVFVFVHLDIQEHIVNFLWIQNLQQQNQSQKPPVH
jgi:hypothetical protein